MRIHCWREQCQYLKSYVVFLTLTLSSFLAPITAHSCPLKGSWKGANTNSSVTFKIVKQGNGCTIKSVSYKDSEFLGLSDITWKNNTLKWTQLLRSSGYLTEYETHKLTGETLEVSWENNKGVSGRTALWKVGSTTERINRELTNKLLIYFNGSKAKTLESDIVIDKFENYKFKDLVLVYGTFIVRGRAVDFLNGHVIPPAGSDIIVKMSDPEHKSEDKLILSGWANGNGGFTGIDNLDIADGVMVTTSDRGVYIYKGGTWSKQH